MLKHIDYIRVTTCFVHLNLVDHLASKLTQHLFTEIFCEVVFDKNYFILGKRTC